MNNKLNMEMDKAFNQDENLNGIYSKYKKKKELQKVSKILSSCTIFLIAFMVLMKIPLIMENENIPGKNYGDEIVKTPIDVVETADLIYINPIGISSENMGGRGDDVDLLSEYDFLKRIADNNNLEIGSQMKIYIEEYEWQKAKDYSKFQENVIYYRDKDNEETSISINFSENDLLGEQIPVLHETIKTSIIQNQELQIFERQISENEENVVGKALFDINGMKFKINVYNISHEKFIEIIKSTIIEYKENLNTYIKSISNEEVIDLYEQAKEMYSWFAVEFPYESLDYENKKGYYIPVKDNRFSTLNELKKCLQRIFTDDIVEYLINKQVENKLFLEIEGKLYVSEYHGGGDITVGKQIISSIVHKDNNTIDVVVLVERLNLKNIMEKIGEEEYKFTLVYDDSKWKFSDFYLVSYDF